MIYGQRIRLRPPERDDLPRFVRWFNDPEVRQGLTMVFGMSLAEEERWFERVLQRPQEERPMVIEVRQGETWTPIGNCTFHNVDWRNRKAEIGIAIGEKAFWNQGYGTEAVRLLLQFGFQTLNLHRIMLRVYAYNRRAIRCYEKAGFVLEGRLRQARYFQGAYHDELIMSVLRDEWNGMPHDPLPNSPAP